MRRHDHDGVFGEWSPDRPDTQQIRRECRYLVDLHGVRHIVMLFHAPTRDGPLAAACADYRRKLPWASVAELRGRQEQDAEELALTREDWAGTAAVAIYRCEVDSRGVIRFADLAAAR